MDQDEGLYKFPDDDYTVWLEENTNGLTDELGHRLGRNSWDTRPWHLDEHLHPTHWTTQRALEFLETRDETRPFFLNLSYVRPHTPFDPPQVYWEMYNERSDEVPAPYHGDWADDWYGDKIPEYPPVNAWVADLPENVINRARIGYYGLISQIDQQLKRVFDLLTVQEELENTLVVMCSDHGEMLGDHNLWRKTYGFEGSARVPMLMRLPESMAGERGRHIDRPVGLEDIMPTFLSVAEAEIPDTVERRNLLNLVSDDSRDDWREFYHGEHAPASYHLENAAHYLVDEDTKYIWNPVTGEDLLFDLKDDPGETSDLRDSNPDRHSEWRENLVSHLEGRPEGFVEEGSLSTVEPKTPAE
ncbi:hypothetical protein AUR64_04285 [Haloprofundus marisrubri]|uniref:Sulfatase N-terminal domain-containing protein n=1 Tax=Haloprofundus marisrubri TaxID=1514971 RepID=A0A0W1REA2_9EURY|nr:sulfatase-like hydrolase/transferase [Haloprofundus marisrubri]KTG11478.1 hypothetical protein AUR64_04285 [Haloprofundus marisrubri]